MEMKTVQELMAASNGGPETVPERFVRKAEGVEKAAAEAEADGLLPLADEAPIIDLSLLPPSPPPPASAEAVADELQSFHSALTSWGCFQAINHGMTGSFLDQVREVAKEFFALPSEEKQRYLRADGDMEGYGSDIILSDQQVLDWTDRLYLTVYPEDRRKLDYWPQKPDLF
ncbi:hypothetical protein CRG98_045953, partial [Punica granatum]